MLAGFMFGAGLMSHSDLLTVFESEIYGFIRIADTGVTYFGLQMLLFLVATTSYLLLLVTIAVISIESLRNFANGPARLLVIAVLLLVVSLSATTLLAINKGFSAKTAEIKLLKEKLQQTGTHLEEHWRWS